MATLASILRIAVLGKDWISTSPATKPLTPPLPHSPTPTTKQPLPLPLPLQLELQLQLQLLFSFAVLPSTK